MNTMNNAKGCTKPLLLLPLTILLTCSTANVFAETANAQNSSDDDRNHVYAGRTRPNEDLGKPGDVYFENSTDGTVAIYRRIADKGWQSLGNLVTDQTGGEGQSCPDGAFVRGIDKSGRVICGGLKAAVSSEKQKCHDHGIIKDGFCKCDEGWTGPECEYKQKPKDPNAPPDEDHDNSPAPGDCNDHDDMVYPGAPDAVDGKDNDCDGVVDEGY